MELRVLRYFLAVAREESISGAAEALHVTQPTLSRQMMELEEELGKTLFLRGKRKISLTEEGVGGDFLSQNRGGGHCADNGGGHTELFHCAHHVVSFEV